MKKIVSSVVALAAIATLSSCGGSANSKETSSSKPKIPFEITSFSYETSGKYLYYAVCLHNPNEDYYIKYPTIRITARDENGGILGSDDPSIPVICPNTDTWSGGQAFSVDETPASVDIEIIEPEDKRYLTESEFKYKDIKPLSVKNAALKNDGEKIVGEVQNDNDYPIDNVAVTVVFKDESNQPIAAANPIFIDDLKANSSTPFDHNLYLDFVTDNFDVYADIWG